MSYKIKEIRDGIKVHFISTNKFKTDLFAIFLTIPLHKTTITQNALIPAVLRRGTENYKTQEDISIELENMYGATLDCGVDKTGDNQLIKFYLETLNDEYLPDKENLGKKSIELLLDVVFNPLLENNKFKEEYVETEKKTIKRLIDGKIDNKDLYAYTRCIEEMYKDKPFGLYKYGQAEDLDNINAGNLYEGYKKLINEAKIDIFISGDFKNEDLLNNIVENINIKKLSAREDKHIINTEETEIKEIVQEKIIKDSMEVTQGKLVLGLDVRCNEAKSRYAVRLYNVILGESATSKMFQNVREKAGLAYTVRSMYVRQKNNIFIRAGIEIENYEKAVKIIKEQIEDMKNGKFTDEDLENAKKYMNAGIRSIQNEQDSEMMYYMAQELGNELIDFNKYVELLNNVTRDDIIKIANTISVNTIYFLRN